MNTTSEMQLVPIDKLIPYVNNARTHSPEQLNKLVVVARKRGRFICLNQRTLAAAITTAAYLQRVGSFHNEWLIVTAHTVG